MNRQRPYCGQHRHLRLLLKQLGREETLLLLGMLSTILPVGEKSITARSVPNRRRRLIIKATQNAEHLYITSVHWERWNQGPFSLQKAKKFAPLILYGLRDPIKSATHSIVEYIQNLIDLIRDSLR
jgi:hypothetical protein